MRLTTEQARQFLERYGCYLLEACDKCGQLLLGPVRYTRKNESGVWCSQECRGDAERPMIRRGGRPRKYRTNAERQRVYRSRSNVTKPRCIPTETKGLQA